MEGSMVPPHAASIALLMFSRFCHLLSDFASDCLITVPTLSALQLLCYLLNLEEGWFPHMQPPSPWTRTPWQWLWELCETLSPRWRLFVELNRYQPKWLVVLSLEEKSFNCVFQGCSTRSSCFWAACGGAPQVSLPGDWVPGRYSCQGKEDLIKILQIVFQIIYHS